MNMNDKHASILLHGARLGDGALVGKEPLTTRAGCCW